MSKKSAPWLPDSWNRVGRCGWLFAGFLDSLLLGRYRSDRHGFLYDQSPIAVITLSPGEYAMVTMDTRSGFIAIAIF